MLGGGMRVRMDRGACLVALGDIGRLAEDHRRARKLAELLAGIEGIKVKNDVRTNTSIVETEETGPERARLIEALRAEEAFVQHRQGRPHGRASLDRRRRNRRGRRSHSASGRRRRLARRRRAGEPY